MLRLIGFLFGVVVALVLLAALVEAPTRERAGVVVQDSLRGLFEGGKPEPTRQGASSTASRSDSALAQARATKTAAASVAAPPMTVSAPTTTPEPPTERPQAPVADADSAGLAPPAPSTEPQAEMPPGESRLLRTPSESREPQPGWHPLWRAFRSKLSAKGFAGELRRLTGQRYRVRRTSPWVYQVELAYADTRQRDAVLQEIRRKTGLGLQEVQP